SDTGTKPLTVSNERSLYWVGLTTQLFVCISSVCPSGRACASASVAINVFPPARFSTTIDALMFSDIFFARVRLKMSVPPPAENGTMSRMGWDGKSDAGADAQVVVAEAVSAKHVKTCTNDAFISCLRNEFC